MLIYERPYSWHCYSLIINFIFTLNCIILFFYFLGTVINMIILIVIYYYKNYYYYGNLQKECGTQNFFHLIDCACGTDPLSHIAA